MDNIGTILEMLEQAGKELKSIKKNMEDLGYLKEYEKIQEQREELVNKTQVFGLSCAEMIVKVLKDTLNESK